MNKLLVSMLLVAGVATQAHAQSNPAADLNSMCAAVYGAVGSLTNQQALKDRGMVFFNHAVKQDPSITDLTIRRMNAMRQDLSTGNQQAIEAARGLTNKCVQFSARAGF